MCVCVGGVWGRYVCMGALCVCVWGILVGVVCEEKYVFYVSVL